MSCFYRNGVKQLVSHLFNLVILRQSALGVSRQGTELLGSGEQWRLS